MGIPVAHEELTADFSVMFRHAIGILSTNDLRIFQSQHGAAFDRIPTQTEPLESLAPLILGAMYEAHPWTDHWETLLWHMAQHYKFWLLAPLEPPPSNIQINCGGSGGGTLSSPHAPLFHCTHTRVNGTCVYGPSLAPADRFGEQGTGVAAGHTTSLHELAMLMSLTTNPCERWEDLGFGRSTTLYRRVQVTLEAASSPSQVTPRFFLEWAVVEALVGPASTYSHVPTVLVTNW